MWVIVEDKFAHIKLLEISYVKSIAKVRQNDCDIAHKIMMSSGQISEKFCKFSSILRFKVAYVELNVAFGRIDEYARY
ncbi:hypothetical protein Mh1949_16140 [Mannheimia haemolytica]|nr:hypothetical protein F382_11710 [Mannheimia haemolytica D153]AGQ39500.1 hypothetical protein J450_10385 [Mannheimia haemolytica D171]AGQ42116.1 hypothetical protein J451_11820 [Mannheimia haemolytica D174]AGR74514.1 hypothetical protein N220_03830 [Mannheimia haemolytica USMARC_2286]EPZ00676.1 hypothetical protein L278_05985 [Mannheimia haemolytica D35]EPZ01841.1 hypothetical protein L279_11520 [Mannheimia haemolytica D38]EPZ24111.1 hypothetical protein L277_03665 [Mannheimia haemolytica D